MISNMLPSEAVARLTEFRIKAFGDTSLYNRYLNWSLVAGEAAFIAAALAVIGGFITFVSTTLHKNWTLYFSIPVFIFSLLVLILEWPRIDPNPARLMPRSLLILPSEPARDIENTIKQNIHAKYPLFGHPIIKSPCYLLLAGLCFCNSETHLAFIVFTLSSILHVVTYLIRPKSKTVPTVPLAKGTRKGGNIVRSQGMKRMSVVHFDKEKIFAKLHAAAEFKGLPGRKVSLRRNASRKRSFVGIALRRQSTLFGFTSWITKKLSRGKSFAEQDSSSSSSSTSSESSSSDDVVQRRATIVKFENIN